MISSNYQTLKYYWSLMKPGIIFGNVIAAAAGFFLAAQGDIDWLLFIATLISVILIIGSACTFNNVIDIDIDGKMQRTCDRVLVKSLVSVNHALWFASLIGLLGFLLIYFAANAIAFLVGLFGFIIYVGFYSLYFKRKSVYGTAVGSLSGACPPVMGYCAVLGQIDIAAIILLVVFCIWQIPHSYAIAIYRFKDYVSADIPVLPLRDGVRVARIHIILYIIAFTLVCLLLSQQNYVGMVYAVCMTLLGLYWIYIAVMGYRKMDSQQWGKKLFLFSIITICCFSMLISLDFVEQNVLVVTAP